MTVYKDYFSRKFLSQLLKFVSIACLIILFPSCEKNEEPKTSDTSPPYAETEKLIRERYDGIASFTWYQYIELMTLLSDDKYIVMPLNDMRRTFNNSAVVVGLRHDVDLNPFKALEMAQIEKQFGFRATYFILSTADYFGTFYNSVLIRNRGMGFLYKELFDTGAEIGIHNDLISVMLLHKNNPFLFNQEELKYYKSLGIPIYGTAAHGAYITKFTAVNYEIFSDFATKDSVTYDGVKYPIGQYSLREFGFKYEAYHINFNHYFSESGGKWNDKDGFYGVIERIKSSIPGDRIQILIHPERWGMKIKTVGTSGFSLQPADS